MPGSAASDFFGDPGVQTGGVPITHRTAGRQIALSVLSAGYL
jgi:hypothetical protein